MIVPDVNLLLYATIDAFPQHAAARQWWEQVLDSDEWVWLADPAIFGFLRISTNPRLIKPPLAAGDACGHVEAWLAQPNVRHATASEQSLNQALGYLRAIGTAGNLTTDAQLAALAGEHGAVIYSNDADFARFDGIRWVNPLAK
jgi:toxin-antitoxin system PIN domain toxin